MKATINNRLTYLDECYIVVDNIQIYMNILPDISDSKSANYADENGIGRSMPFKTFNNSENRSISWTAHFVAGTQFDIYRILQYLRIFESAVYPMDVNTGGASYAPPPICKLRCGQLLGNDEICAIMKSYSVKFDTSVPWDESTYMPYKLDVDMQFDVVYNQAALPGSEKILRDGF